MAQRGDRQQATRKWITVLLLVLLATGFFVASFFALPK
jgi:Ni,Fe-hydrogenase I cytochrome b subunit